MDYEFIRAAHAWVTLLYAYVSQAQKHNFGHVSNVYCNQWISYNGDIYCSTCTFCSLILSIFLGNSTSGLFWLSCEYSVCGPGTVTLVTQLNAMNAACEDFAGE